MVDLSTTYLGLELENPLVPSSSPLTGKLEKLKQMEDLGVSAVVLPSLFEEEVNEEEHNMHMFLDHQCIGYGEASSFLPEPIAYTSSLDHYLEHIASAKNALSIPIIGSLNGITNEGWIAHARDLEVAGCDAIEINAYYVAADCTQSSVDIEQRYIEILKSVIQTVSIPVSMKLSSQFTSPGHLIKQLENEGLQGVALFNRFYQPDVDIETLHTKPKISLSHTYETLLRIRWIAILRHQVGLSLAATGGFHSYQDVIKALLAGADAVYLCSVLLQQGINEIEQIKTGLSTWLEEHEYESIAQLKGSISYGNAIDPSLYERANYLEVMSDFIL